MNYDAAVRYLLSLGRELAARRKQRRPSSISTTSASSPSASAALTAPTQALTSPAPTQRLDSRFSRIDSTLRRLSNRPEHVAASGKNQRAHSHQRRRDQRRSFRGNLRAHPRPDRRTPCRGKLRAHPPTSSVSPRWHSNTSLASASNLGLRSRSRRAPRCYQYRSPCRFHHHPNRFRPRKFSGTRFAKSLPKRQAY